MKVRAKISANIMLVLTGEYVGMDYNDCVQQALEACRERGKSVNETTVLQSRVEPLVESQPGEQKMEATR
jgi:hypothetical protein